VEACLTLPLAHVGLILGNKSTLVERILIAVRSIFHMKSIQIVLTHAFRFGFPQTYFRGAVWRHPAAPVCSYYLEVEKMH